MRAIEKILSRSEGVEPRKLHVPEWDLEVYWTPVTAEDFCAIEAQTPRDTRQLAVYLLIRKAEDASGKRLFSVADTHTLLARVDLAPIVRVTAAMMEDLASLAPVPQPQPAQTCPGEAESEA